MYLQILVIITWYQKQNLNKKKINEYGHKHGYYISVALQLHSYYIMVLNNTVIDNGATLCL